jgi:hypothetical protein
MRFWGTFLILVLVCPRAVEAQGSIAAQLSAKEKQLESLYAEYWRTEYQIALGDEHVSSRPVQENIRAVISDEKFLHQLKEAHFRDPLLRRRRDLFLEEASYTKITNAPKLTALVEDITRNENTMSYNVGSRQLTRAQLTDVVTHNPNREIRREAWEARSQIATANAEHIRQAIKLRNALATQYTDELFSTFMLHRKGLETEKLFEWFDNIRSQTEPEYQALLMRIRDELHIAKVEPWDLEFYFSALTDDFEQQRFLPSEGWMKAKQLGSTLGYDLAKMPVEMRIADLSFPGAAYPVLYGKDVKILANRYSGILFYDRLFHATGHAMHYSMMNEPSFLLRANYAEPFDEGLAQVMALMLYRPEVDTELFGLTPEQAHIVGETYALKEIFDLRNTMADSLFEFEAYADPDQDLTAVYNRIHSKYLGVDMHGAAVWAYNPMYGSDPIYLQSYVVGEIVARQISHKIDRTFGARWSKEAGTYLKTYFYSRGAGQTLDGIMQNGTGEALSPGYLVEHLHAAQSPQPSDLSRASR